MNDPPTRDVSLTEAAARLAGILAIAADAIVSIDEQQRITLFNHGAEAIFGYASSEALGQPLDLLLPERYRVHHGAHIRQFAVSPIAARRMGERQTIYGRRKDGEEFPAEASISKLDFGGRHTFTVVLRDISERRRAEKVLAESHAELEARVAERTAELRAEIHRREQTEAQLLRTQRMEAFGQLTGGVAHDFNNLLTVIAGNLELLEMRITGDKERELLKRALDASEMGARLTSRLLTFARRRQFASAALDLNDQIMGMVELLQRTLGDHIDLVTRLSPQLWAVRADPSEIENAVLNLAINARDAMPRGGQLTLATANITTADGEIGAFDKLVAGDYVRLVVSDTGVGMPLDVAQHAFEPFFTTKPPGKGTGLGLSTIYGFVQAHGGTATIDSAIGYGTTVSLYLPRLRSELAMQTADRTASSPVGAGEMILLVEDNADVRAVMRQHLEGLGYRVREADSGPAALETLTAGARIDLVFSDVVMPGGMTGFDVRRAVLSHWPGVKVLLTSGYPDEALREHGGDATGIFILAKPASRAEFARAIRQALES